MQLEPLTRDRAVDPHTENKSAIASLRSAMVDFDERTVRAALAKLVSPQAVIHMPHPFGDLVGPDALYDSCYAPLLDAMPDLERRDWIVMGGQTEHGGDWILFSCFCGEWLASKRPKQQNKIEFIHEICLIDLQKE